MLTCVTASSSTWRRYRVLRKVREFPPTMRIQGYLKGQLIDITVKEFFAHIDQTGPAKDLEAEIEAIDVIGTAANLRIDCEDWHGVHYSDFMNLLKIDGVWKIAGKVFDTHESR